MVTKQQLYQQYYALYSYKIDRLTRHKKSSECKGTNCEMCIEQNQSISFSKKQIELLNNE